MASAASTTRRTGSPNRPDGVPDDVVLAWTPREPVATNRSGLGIPVALKPLATTPPNRLVTIGDSITHGFKSFAIADTALSWPAVLARTVGIPDFRYPTYPGPANCPGLPFNIEASIRELDALLPKTLANPLPDLKVLARFHSVMNDVEEFWERGPGADLVTSMPGPGPINHNLAVWGWDLRDVMSKTVADCQYNIAVAKHSGRDFAAQVPSAAGDRSALPVLAGGGLADTPISLARRLGDEGQGDDPGIETLVVAVGANNALGTVINFTVKWSKDETFQGLRTKQESNLWTPTHFAIELAELVNHIRCINAHHVIWFTVPHVTIAPMLRGVGQDKMNPRSRYFVRYTRPWITDVEFHANRHPSLSGDLARTIDSTIDQYNDMIVAAVRAARLEGRDWRVLDIAGILDRLAYRRYITDETARPPWWTEYPLPDAYDVLSPQVDTRFYGSDRFGRTQGGLIALDGIHPTTLGYGLLANEVLHVMTAAGVESNNTEVNFAELVAADTLIQHPPVGFSSLWTFMSSANRAADFWQALHGQAPL